MCVCVCECRERDNLLNTCPPKQTKKPKKMQKRNHLTISEMFSDTVMTNLSEFSLPLVDPELIKSS